MLERHRLAYYEDDKKVVMKGEYELDPTASVVRLQDQLLRSKHKFQLNAKGSGRRADYKSGK